MVKLAIAILLMLAGCALATHNPLVPDTLYSLDAAANYEGYIYQSKSSFAACRAFASGTAVTSNTTSGSERCVWYKTNASNDSTQLSRYYMMADTLNGTFASHFPANWTLDSVMWSPAMDGNVDSADCGDTLYVFPIIGTQLGPSTTTSLRFNDIYSGVGTNGFDVTLFATLKKANSRLSTKMPDRWVDSVEVWVKLASPTRFTGVCMLTCADFKQDSVAANTGNYIESMALFHDEVTAAYNRPYFLFYWTETTTSISGGAGNARSNWRGRWLRQDMMLNPEEAY